VQAANLSLHFLNVNIYRTSLFFHLFHLNSIDWYDMQYQMKVVIDTNVLVAALRPRRDASFKLAAILPSDKFSIAISVPLVS